MADGEHPAFFPWSNPQWFWDDTRGWVCRETNNLVYKYGSVGEDEVKQEIVECTSRREGGVGEVAEDANQDLSLTPEVLEELEAFRNSFETLGEEIGALVDKKNKAYGNSFDKCGKFLQLLYPNGTPSDEDSLADMLCLVRIFDKMIRIATDKDAFGESPYGDITGYGLLGLRRHRRKLAEQK